MGNLDILKAFSLAFLVIEKRSGSSCVPRGAAGAPWSGMASPGRCGRTVRCGRLAGAADVAWFGRLVGAGWPPALHFGYWYTIRLQKLLGFAKRF